MIREAVKNIFFAAYNCFKKQTARTPLLSVLVYHRVSDDFHDAVSVSPKNFAAQMKLLCEKCTPCHLPECIEHLPQPEPEKPLVAVTFDDGYKDNFTHAFPILEEYGLRASFFVPTAFVGTNTALPHDQQRLGIAVPLMTWEDLAALRDAGHHIGSHTARHIDCGQASLDEIQEELRESANALREQLGLERTLFAYPYGQRKHFSAAAREAVQNAGFIACLSACGGKNPWPPDWYDLKRSGVDDRYGLQAFEALLRGYEPRHYRS